MQGGYLGSCVASCSLEEGVLAVGWGPWREAWKSHAHLGAEAGAEPGSGVPSCGQKLLQSVPPRSSPGALSDLLCLKHQVQRDRKLSATHLRVDMVRHKENGCFRS